jgi:hypothetical protein
MDDFAKHLKSMLESMMKSGGEVSFDIKSFDLDNAPPFIKMFLGNNAERKEKVVVRKLSEEELTNYKDLVESKEQLQRQLKRLVTLQKKLDLDFELFWQDAKENTDKNLEGKKLSVDLETGFLFQDVNVNNKQEEQENE